MTTRELFVNLKTPHDEQWRFKRSRAKRKLLRAGRRSGKTTIAADDAIEGDGGLLEGGRVLYAAPTQEQTDKFWFEVTSALEEPIKAGVYKVNFTRRTIERPGTENRIKAKTAWDANSLRGDFGSKIILDEYQQMKPDVLRRVVYPMLLDVDGWLTVIYTPDDEDESGTHARDLCVDWERRMEEAREERVPSRWEVFTFTSLDNPHLSSVALEEITEDMDELAYRQEILAQHLDEAPGALWSHALLASTRWKGQCPDLGYVIVAVDPPAKASGAECGIVVGGRREMEDGKLHAFVTADLSLRGKPGRWGNRVVAAYDEHLADKVVGEVNNGGDMVESTVKVAAGDRVLSFKQVRASRGKAIRAEPVSILYSEGRVHHVGIFDRLERQMTGWVPGKGVSPDRLDALVWLITELLLGPRGWARGVSS